MAINDTTIFVVSHKFYKEVNNDLYKTIQVGKKNSNILISDIADDTGINIAEKNPNYCELTAFYWLWKNCSNVKNIGICHYRRYFTNNNICKASVFFASKRQINKILSNYDIILPKPNRLSVSVKEYYIKCDGLEKDLHTTRNVIVKKFPNYVSSFDTIINDKEACYCNMFISSKKIFDEYCEWLFDILFEVEKNTDLSEYTKAQSRVYGYLSEILLNVWVRYNKLHPYYMSVVNTETSLKYRLMHINRQ